MTATILLGGQIDKVQGGHDDSTDDGVLNVKQMQGSLVKVLLQMPGAGLFGLTTGVIGGASLSAAKTTWSNSDGSGQSYNLICPAVTSGAQSGAWVEQTIYGGRIGVRFRRDNATANPAFTVYVDGVPFPVRNVIARTHAVVGRVYGDYEALFMLAEDFGPGPHTVRVSVAGAPIGGSARTLWLFGFVADRVAGYEDPRRFALLPQAKTSVPSSATNITTTSRYGAIRKVYLHNTDTVTRTVTFTIGSDVVATRVMTTGTSAELDFGEPMPQTLKWAADAASVVNGWVQEAV